MRVGHLALHGVPIDAHALFHLDDGFTHRAKKPLVS